MSLVMRYLAVAVLLLGSLGGCVDPRCPNGYDQMGDICRRKKDGGMQDASESSTAGDSSSGDASQSAGDGDPEAGDVDGADDAGFDADIADAGDAGPPLEYALASVGASCSADVEGSLACAEHASRTAVKCQQGKWTLAETCAANERCDSRRGTEQGKCAPMPPVCADKVAGDVCDGQVRLNCGIDLLTVTTNACPAHAHCSSDPSPVQCECDLGYREDDHGACVNDDDCPADACAHGSCVDGLDDYSCNCGDGYAGTGTKLCSKVDYCPKDACTPGGTCIDRVDWSCQCGTGFAGTGTPACANVNDCNSGACNAPSNGTCTDGIVSHSCSCKPGFSGTECQNDICSPNPCKNGGTCSRTGPLCSCPAGFSGVNCQIDACSPNPCQHGGTCSRTSQGASCNCSGTGYTGTSCQTDVNECASANTCSADYPCVQTAAPGYTCQGQFADWPMPDAITSSKTKPSYSESGFQVTDDVTGLHWEQFPDDAVYTWEEAKAHCTDSTLAGSTDWRLPTLIELESLIDDTVANPPINAQAFPNAPEANYWTSSPVVGGTNALAWFVGFNNLAGASSSERTTKMRARCVRGPLTPYRAASPHYAIDTSASPATTTDQRTGLIWQRVLDATSRNLAASKAYCASLGGGWRLPTRKELLTLLDPTIALDASPIDSTAFPNVPNNAAFWSVSPSASAAGRSWFVSIVGVSGTQTEDRELRVRCVR